MKIVMREKTFYRKINSSRWGSKFESAEFSNTFRAEVDVDSIDKEGLKKIDEELYNLAVAATHNDAKKYVKEQRAKR